MATQFQADRAKFAVGTRVKIDTRQSQGHCRTPVYLRGCVGEVAAIQGAFLDPERLAYFKPGLPARVLYKVRIAMSDLFPGTTKAAHDDLEVDIYEHWLTPADPSEG